MRKINKEREEYSSRAFSNPKPLHLLLSSPLAAHCHVHLQKSSDHVSTTSVKAVGVIHAKLLHVIQPTASSIKIPLMSLSNYPYFQGLGKQNCLYL